jgi:hypothetical protein
MAGLSHRDVALLNSSLEGLGNTFMQNRLLDEKMKERADERTYREGRDLKQDKYRQDALDLKKGRDLKQDEYRKDALDLKKRSNEINAAGTVEIFAQTGNEPDGGFFKWRGSPEGLDALRKQMPNMKILPKEPKAAPRLGMRTISGPGGNLVLYLNTQQDVIDATRAMQEVTDKGGEDVKYLEVKHPETGEVIWAGAYFSKTGAHENPKQEREPTISDTTSTEIDPITKQPIIKSSRTVRGTPAQVEKYKPVIPEHDKKGKADGSRFKIIGTE